MKPKLPAFDHYLTIKPPEGLKQIPTEDQIASATKFLANRNLLIPNEIRESVKASFSSWKTLSSLKKIKVVIAGDYGSGKV
jgi:hypothetical protein